MSMSVCPIAVVAAPIERVWALLANPSSYDLWWDAGIVGHNQLVCTVVDGSSTHVRFG